MPLHKPEDKTFLDRMPPIPEEADTRDLADERRASADRRHESALREKTSRVARYLGRHNP